MSEYQRYEFMTSDRPLTRAQLDAVNALSSHIEATSTHALIEYQWGDFKHDPIKVLHEFFDGFLYWANWGAPELAFRFPHGILPSDLLDSYDFDEFATFTQFPDYDILDIQFGEMEGPDEWVEYELGSLIEMRNELMEGDPRTLYIVWLASQRMMGEPDEEVEDEIGVPPVPPVMGALTAAQQALAELLQVPHELLVAAARHSAAKSPPQADVTEWITLLPPDRRTEYLVRLAHNEPGLSRLLAKELRDLGQSGQHKDNAEQPTGEHVAYATLLTESQGIRAQVEREKREQERLARQRHLQDVHDHQDQYWRQVDRAVERGSGAGYDEAALVLSELSEVATHFNETEEFQERFRTWVGPHLRRPAFVKRLQSGGFPLPEA